MGVGVLLTFIFYSGNTSSAPNVTLNNQAAKEISLVDNVTLLTSMQDNRIIFKEITNLKIELSDLKLQDPVIEQTDAEGNVVAASSVTRIKNGYLIQIELTDYIKDLDDEQQLEWLNSQFWTAAEIIAKWNVQSKDVNLKRIEVFKLAK